jgi:hypothetical protein
MELQMAEIPAPSNTASAEACVASVPSHNLPDKQSEFADFFRREANRFAEEGQGILMAKLERKKEQNPGKLDTEAADNAVKSFEKAVYYAGCADTLNPKPDVKDATHPESHFMKAMQLGLLGAQQYRAGKSDAAVAAFLGAAVELREDLGQRRK